MAVALLYLKLQWLLHCCISKLPYRLTNNLNFTSSLHLTSHGNKVNHISNFVLIAGSTSTCTWMKERCLTSGHHVIQSSQIIYIQTVQRNPSTS
uniref:Secreted protein n=1 Tax=Arundo donax TaxID=35708 RepID=A0A0A8Y5R8_ARUDO